MVLVSSYRNISLDVSSDDIGSAIDNDGRLPLKLIVVCDPDVDSFSYKEI